MDKVLVVGSGLVGSCVSAFLADLGYDVEVSDRHLDPRSPRAAGGRSINLTVCERGFAALGRIGAAEAVRAVSVPCRGRIIHAADGGTAICGDGAEAGVDGSRDRTGCSAIPRANLRAATS